MPVAELVHPSRQRHSRTEPRHFPGEERRDVTINLRAPAQTRDLIDCAARCEGKSRTEFMLDSAARRAEEVLLQKRLFILEAEHYDELLRLLDAPPPPNGALKRLLVRKSPWEK